MMRLSATLLRRMFVAAIVSAAASPAVLAAQSDACIGQRACQAVRDFSVTVTDFRPSMLGKTRVFALTLRIRNLTSRPLYLGYVGESGLLTDDQGNRYTVSAASVRGIGIVSNAAFDPKFVLQPGEASDARAEWTFTPDKQILGTTYTLDFALREIDPLPGDQFRLGREHSFQMRGFPGIMTTAIAEAPAAAPAPTPAPPPPAAPATPPEPADACAGKARCYNAGPFMAEITQVTPSRPSAKVHMLQVTMRIRNIGTDPIILAYQQRTSILVDDLGNQYTWYAGYAVDQSASGIGTIILGRTADPQFRLRPGEARTVSFAVRRAAAPNAAIGTSFTHNLVLHQLEVLPSSQVRSLREFAVGFQDFTVSGAVKARSLIDEISKAVKKPR